LGPFTHYLIAHGYQFVQQKNALSQLFFDEKFKTLYIHKQLPRDHLQKYYRQNKILLQYQLVTFNFGSDKN